MTTVSATEPIGTLGVSVRSGARWQFADQLIETIVAVAMTVVLARAVGPHLYGLTVVAITIVSVLSTIMTGPLATAVVTLRLRERTAFNTAFWMAVLPAFAVSIVIGCPAFAFLPVPLAATWLAVIASFPLQCPAAFAMAALQRELRFRALSIARLAAVGIANLGALALVVAHHGLAALVFRLLAVPALQWLLCAAAAGWRPRATIDRAVVSSVSRYARGVAAYDLFNQIVRNGDNLLIGIVLGSSPLGFYNIGYQFLGLPVGQVSSVTTNVALPALSQMDDNERFKASLLRVQKVAVWCVAPIAIGAIVLGDAAVREVLGARWAPAGTLVQIFGAVALVQVAATQSGAIYLARRSTDLLFRWGRIVAPVFVISFLIGLPWGTVGVAVAYLVANLALFYPNWSVPGPIIGLRPGEVIGALRVELGLAVAIAVSGSAWRLLTGPPAIGLLLTVGASLALGYWLSAIIIDRDLRADVVGLLARRAMLEKVAPG